MADQDLPDTGYSWVVLLAAFMLNIHYAGGVGCVGVFLVEFSDHFNASKSAVTWIGGLLLCTGFIFGAPMGWLCRMLGCRLVGLGAAILCSVSLILSSFATNVMILYFTYGIGASIGFSTFYNTGTIAIHQYFERRRALAGGVAVAGVSAGVFLWAPFARWSIDTYGWRGALVLHAGIHLHAMIFATLLKPPPKFYSAKEVEMTSWDTARMNTNNVEASLSTENRAESRSAQTCPSVKLLCAPIVKQTHFVGFLVGVLMIQSGHIIPYSLVPTRTQAMGIDKTLGATLVSIMGVSSGCARALFGYIGDFGSLNRVIACGLSGLVAGLLTTLSTFLVDYMQMAIYAGVLGITSAAYIALQGTSVVDIVGRDDVPQGIGFLSLVIGLAHMVALAVSGSLMDAFHDPRYAFLVFGIVELVGGAIVVTSMTSHILRTRCLPRPAAAGVVG